MHFLSNDPEEFPQYHSIISSHQARPDLRMVASSCPHQAIVKSSAWGLEHNTEMSRQSARCHIIMLICGVLLRSSTIIHGHNRQLVGCTFVCVWVIMTLERLSLFSTYGANWMMAHYGHLHWGTHTSDIFYATNYPFCSVKWSNAIFLVLSHIPLRLYGSSCLKLLLWPIESDVCSSRTISLCWF